MDFSLPAAVPPLLDDVERFLADVVRPLERDVLHAGFAASHAKLEAMRAEAKRRGLWAPHLPKDLGGLGLSLLEFAFVSERLGSSPLGHYACNCQAPDAGNMEILREHAT